MDVKREVSAKAGASLPFLTDTVNRTANCLICAEQESLAAQPKSKEELM